MRLRITTNEFEVIAIHNRASEIYKMENTFFNFKNLRTSFLFQKKVHYYPMQSKRAISSQGNSFSTFIIYFGIQFFLDFNILLMPYGQRSLSTHLLFIRKPFSIFNYFQSLNMVDARRGKIITMRTFVRPHIFAINY